MMMAAKSGNRYDVFKNEAFNGGFEVQQKQPPQQQQQQKAETAANPDLFKDFATAAFNEFKVDRPHASTHEFSNKMSDKKLLPPTTTASLLSIDQRAKVITSCMLLLLLLSSCGCAASFICCCCYCCCCHLGFSKSPCV